MTDFWVNDCAAMGATQRLNFSYFLAKCASTGLDHDRLFQITLLVFRDTFETARPLGSINDTDTENFSMAALLTSACAWLREAGRKIILFSDISWHDCPDDIGREVLRSSSRSLVRSLRPLDLVRGDSCIG